MLNSFITVANRRCHQYKKMRAITVVLVGLLAMATAASDKKVVCYFGSWAVYRPNSGKFDIEDIDPTLCTHMIYTFVGISEDGDVKILDSWQDLGSDYGKNGFARFNKLRELSPETKTLIAIGGWNEGSTKYSHVVANPTLRKRFVDNVVKFVKKYEFDGFDIDWEYPNQRGGVKEDRENYVALLRELREKFDHEGLILSAAVGAAEKSAGLSYIIKDVAEQLHFINLMTYDLHGIWDEKTGINAPLYAGSWEKTDAERQLNVNASVHYWLDNGAPAEKLILGVPFYGRGFSLVNEHNNTIGAPANQPAIAGPYTREPGMLGYNEICEKFIKEKWNVQFQEEQRVPFAVNGNQWVGYDDERSLSDKAEFVKKLGLGGMMLWSVETDDFKGICGEKYPLLKTINAVLRDGAVALPTKAPQKPTTKKPNSTTQSANEATTEKIENQSTTELPSDVPEANDICKEDGYIRDPKKCNVFYYCQIVEGKYQAHKFSCPDPLVYDLTTKGCNYSDKVKC